MLRLPKIRFPGMAKLNDALDRMREAVEWNAAIKGAGGITVDPSAAGPVIRANLPPRMTVKLLSSIGGGAYTAAEVVEQPSGAWASPSNAWAGTVYEFNGNATLPVSGSFRAEVVLSAVGEWRFQAGTC